MTPEGNIHPSGIQNEEHIASMKGLGHAITITRERRGITRKELASKCEMTVRKLELIEGADLEVRWGDVARLAAALGMPLPEMFVQAEEHAPGRGGERWRQRSAEAESHSTVPGARSDAAEGRKST